MLYCAAPYVGRIINSWSIANSVWCQWPPLTRYSLFEVGWREQFAVEYLLTNSRRVPGDRVDGTFANFVAGSIGPAAFQFIRHVHYVGRQYVLACRRQRGIVQARDRDFHNRVLRALAVLGIVESKLDRVHAWAQ